MTWEQNVLLKAIEALVPDVQLNEVEAAAFSIYQYNRLLKRIDISEGQF